MKNGVKIIRKTDHCYKVTFIPEELIELNDINCKIETRLANQAIEEANEQARISEANRQKDEANRREQAHRQQIQKTIRGCISLFAIASAAWLAVPMELATPILAAVVSVPCLGGVCYKLGTIK